MHWIIETPSLCKLLEGTFLNQFNISEQIHCMIESFHLIPFHSSLALNYESFLIFKSLNYLYEFNNMGTFLGIPLPKQLDLCSFGNVLHLPQHTLGIEWNIIWRITQSRA